eukprot:sb/3474016/
MILVDSHRVIGPQFTGQHPVPDEYPGKSGSDCILMLLSFVKILLRFYKNQEVHFTNFTFFAAVNEKSDFFQEALSSHKTHQSIKITFLGVKKLSGLEPKRIFSHEVLIRSAQESFPVEPKNPEFPRNCGPCQHIEVPKHILDS